MIKVVSFMVSLRQEEEVRISGRAQGSTSKDDGEGHPLPMHAIRFEQGYGLWKYPAAVIIGFQGGYRLLVRTHDCHRYFVGRDSYLPPCGCGLTLGTLLSNDEGKGAPSKTRSFAPSAIRFRRHEIRYLGRRKNPELTTSAGFISQMTVTITVGSRYPSIPARLLAVIRGYLNR